MACRWIAGGINTNIGCQQKSGGISLVGVQGSCKASFTLSLCPGGAHEGAAKVIQVAQLTNQLAKKKTST